MIRNIIVTLFFFFGPALLMLVLRNIFLYWKEHHFKQKKQEDIIDITPVGPASPSRLFLISAITVGLISAYLVYGQLTMSGEKVEMKYIPAHINAQGELVPEQYIPRP